jgi:putative sigma-54 modulation protein
MRVQIVGRGIQVSPAMKAQTEKKLSRMDKYFEPNAEVRCVVTYSVVHIDQFVEINIAARHVNLRAKVKANDAYAALDLCLDKLEGQMRKMKTQFLKIQKRNSLSEDMKLDMLENEKEPESIDKIVKTKKLVLTPMDAEEALARMDALDHSFFIYRDSTTDKECVLYKREEGDYGVIEIDG